VPLAYLLQFYGSEAMLAVTFLASEHQRYKAEYTYVVPQAAYGKLRHLAWLQLYG